MKKQKIYSLLLITLFGLTFSQSINTNTIKANELETNDEVSSEVITTDELEDRALAINSTTYIGSSINLAKNELVDYNQVKINNPIFDPEWDFWKNGIRTSAYSTMEVILESNSFQGIVNELEDQANLNANCYAGYSLLTGTAGAKFSDSTFDYPSYYYQYYSTYSFKINVFTYQLRNYKTNLFDYQCYLSDEYYDDAEAFIEGNLDRNTFFDRYGTHIIAKGTFGGEFSINYSIASSYYDVWSDYYSAITSYLHTSLYSKVFTGSTAHFDVLGNFSFDPELADENINYVTRGGSNSIDISHANLQAAVAQWADSVSATPKLIEVARDGLIPLWDILPLGCDTEENRNYFIEQYSLYTEEAEQEIKEIYEPEILNNENGSETGYWLVRYGEVLVDDTGVFNQHYDIVYLNETYDLKYDYMRVNNFTLVDIYVMMEMREINSGYQIIRLYSSEKEDEAYFIDEFMYEYEGNSLGSEYGSSICFVRYSIPISTFENSDPEDCYKLVIRYSASGMFSDDWINKNIRVNVVYRR